MSDSKKLIRFAKLFFYSISGCISEYGMKVSEKMSKVKVVCINEVRKERRWNFGEVE